MSEVMEMRRGSALRVIRMIRPDPVAVSVLLLAVCFLIGGLIGDIYARSCDEASQTAFRQYLSDYCLWLERSEANIPLGRCIFLYVSFVCAAFLFGLSPSGMIALPICTAGFGFLSFYTVSCFVQAFGREGVLLAVSLTALRLLFTLPCYFFTAGKAMVQSTRLLLFSAGRGKRIRAASDSRPQTTALLVCLICLCIGIFCERLLTPVLFRAVIGRFHSFF